MKNNETGEFELVLGNRQLLSGFFIIVILFAVFFVMGYIVGRNSTPTAQFAANREPLGNTAAASTGDRPQAASGPAPASQPAAAAQTSSNAAKDDPSDTATPPPPTTQAAQTAPAKAEALPPAAAPVESTPGETYLQVTAVKPDVAETVARTLKDKGFPAVLSPGPSGKTRVLVGPYSDLAKLGQAKAELEHLGFSPFVKR